MPEFSYEPRTSNDKSALSEGWHPAFLLDILDEPTPEDWQMYKQSPRMWRWIFAVWEVPTLIDRQIPERQSAPTSQKFSPGGKYQASKAYEWACQLVGHKIQPGERTDLVPMCPLPCRIKIERKEQYANIKDLEKWPEGQQVLTPELRAKLLEFLTHPPEPQPQNGTPQPSTPPPAQPPTPQPGMQTWGRPAQQTATATSGRPSF